MLSAWSDVVAVAPSLATVETATQNYLLDAVNNRWIDDDVWGVLADDGRRYLAAHVATLRTGHGFVTAESIGAMSRSYSVPVGIMGSLGLTAYGVEYQRLVELLPPSIGMVV